MIENTIRTFADNLLEAIIITTISDRKCVYANQAALDLLGYSLEEVKSMFIFDFITEEELEKARNAIAKNKAKPYEIDLLAKNGELIPVRTSGSVLNGFDENYRITNFVDLREIKEKERLLFLESKHSAMGELINMIAHQWRQPLSLISTSISGLEMKNECGFLNDGDISKTSKDILNTVNFLSETIEDFKNFNSVDKDFSNLLLSNKVDSALSLIFENCNKCSNLDIKKNYNVFSEISTIKSELLQAILTILKNCLDAFQLNKIDNPKIIISIYEDNNNQYITILDNAGGIPKDVIDRIYEPYFTTKHSAVGTGLGLYMTKTIIENHCKGKISVSNKNGGAEFKIALPK